MTLISAHAAAERNQVPCTANPEESPWSWGLDGGMPFLVRRFPMGQWLLIRSESGSAPAPAISNGPRARRPALLNLASGITGPRPAEAVQSEKVDRREICLGLGVGNGCWGMGRRGGSGKIDRLETRL